MRIRIAYLALTTTLLACGGLNAAESKDTGSNPQAATNNDTQPSVHDLTLHSTPGQNKDKSPVAGKVFTDSGMNTLVTKAKQTLTAKIETDDKEIQVLQAEYVTWRDSSFGCPKSEHQYMQVLSNGAQIKLFANGKVYSFHSSNKKPLFYCRKPSAQAPISYEFGDL